MGFSHLWSHVAFGSALSLKTSLSSFALISNRFSCQLASIWSYAAPIASIIIKFYWNELSLLDKVYAHVCEINQLSDSFYNCPKNQKGYQWFPEEWTLLQTNQWTMWYSSIFFNGIMADSRGRVLTAFLHSWPVSALFQLPPLPLKPNLPHFPMIKTQLNGLIFPIIYSRIIKISSD